MTKHLILLTAILLISMMSNNFSLYGKGYGIKETSSCRSDITDNVLDALHAKELNVFTSMGISI